MIIEDINKICLCPIFSSFSHGQPYGQRDETSNYTTVLNYLEQKKVQKPLLLGIQSSGTSIIFKQMHSSLQPHVNMHPWLKQFGKTQ
ncbi:hypothetical protein Ahy_A01g004216 [Arachis hypogaea]|uniref:Uncharacterized protein n=1 Tax=Arachis hypogaea TaxID=3818 RepID=A0A445EVI4_ARAHY|nr:hypothetical protein Ahy_A01g004216 [Arachis hypogaea]